jgi:hypothetical protein
VARALPAVDVKDLACYKFRRLEVEDAVDDLGNLAHAANGVQGAELRMGFARVLGVLITPGETALTLMPRLAYSMASDLHSNRLSSATPKRTELGSWRYRPTSL